MRSSFYWLAFIAALLQSGTCLKKKKKKLPSELCIKKNKNLQQILGTDI